MTNYEKIAKVASEHVGLALNNDGWKELVFQAFPETRAKATSIMPNDLRYPHCPYGDKVFAGGENEKGYRGLLTALPADKVIKRQGTSRSTGDPIARQAEIAAAVAKAIAEHDAAKAKQPVVKVLPQITAGEAQSKGNGVAKQ